MVSLCYYLYYRDYLLQNLLLSHSLWIPKFFLLLSQHLLYNLYSFFLLFLTAKKILITWKGNLYGLLFTSSRSRPSDYPQLPHVMYTWCGGMRVVCRWYFVLIVHACRGTLDSHRCALKIAFCGVGRARERSDCARLELLFSWCFERYSWNALAELLNLFIELLWVGNPVATVFDFWLYFL